MILIILCIHTILFRQYPLPLCAIKMTQLKTGRYICNETPRYLTCHVRPLGLKFGCLFFMLIIEITAESEIHPDRHQDRADHHTYPANIGLPSGCGKSRRPTPINSVYTDRAVTATANNRAPSALSDHGG